jgi:hypothetical protein
MARIKIEDLPRDRKVSGEEMKKITGGAESDAQIALTAGGIAAAFLPGGAVLSSAMSGLGQPKDTTTDTS